MGERWGGWVAISYSHQSSIERRLKVSPVSTSTTGSTIRLPESGQHNSGGSKFSISPRTRLDKIGLKLLKSLFLRVCLSSPRRRLHHATRSHSAEIDRFRLRCVHVD